MKLLVFAHTPPPHHGQSYMVQLMLGCFGGDHRQATRPASGSAAAHGLECYHVNSRVSRELEDIGDFRVSKVFLLLGYCLQAVWCRFRYGVTTFYYVPAPGKRSALYRDWLVMLLCRPFFPRVILHWHAAGLANWLETASPMRTRSITYQRMRHVELSIVLSEYNRADAEKLMPRRVRVVNNGIPDPCPDFTRSVLPRREARARARRKIAAGQAPDAADLRQSGGDPRVFNILYLAHCTEEKGLFDTLHGVIAANNQLRAAASPLSLHLQVAGSFVLPAERAEFDRLVLAAGGPAAVTYLGFVHDETKNRAFVEADLFCFPSFYQNENQPVNLIEAMAFGLPILTTRWRSIPELFPPDYPYLVDIRAPQQIADTLLLALTGESPASLRDRYLRAFTLEQHLAGLAEALRSVDAGPHPTGAPAGRPLPAH